MCINNYYYFFNKLKRWVNTKKRGSDLYFLKLPCPVTKNLQCRILTCEVKITLFLLLTRELINP